MNLDKLLKKIRWFLTANKTIDDLPDALVFVGANGYVEQFNRKAQEMLGFIEDEKIFFNDVIIDGTDKINESLHKLKPILATATIPAREFYVELNASKKEHGYCVSLRDLTKLTNEIINEEKTLKFNNEKNAMLAKLEGDIKSPLTSISGFSKGLLDGLGGELSPKQEKYIKIINNNAEELYHFLDKFFEFSLAESSIYEPEYKNFDIVETFKTILNDMNKIFKAKELSYDFDYDFIEKRTVYTDFKAVKKIVTNIINVALSMTEKGYISVKLTYPDENFCAQYNMEIPTEKLKSYICITIKDTGMGIADEDMKYLCEPYAQLGKNKRNFMRALKLGSASILTKRANGVIRISSDVMKGTQYDIIIPIEKSLNE